MTNFEHMAPGEFWATIYKALANGASFGTWTINQMLEEFPLTPEEQAETARKAEEHLVALLAIRAGTSA